MGATSEVLEVQVEAGFAEPAAAGLGIGEGLGDQVPEVGEKVLDRSGGPTRAP